MHRPKIGQGLEYSTILANLRWVAQELPDSTTARFVADMDAASARQTKAKASKSVGMKDIFDGYTAARRDVMETHADGSQIRQTIWMDLANEDDSTPGLNQNPEPSQDSPVWGAVGKIIQLPLQQERQGIKVWNIILQSGQYHLVSSPLYFTSMP